MSLWWNGLFLIIGKHCHPLSTADQHCPGTEASLVNNCSLGCVHGRDLNVHIPGPWGRLHWGTKPELAPGVLPDTETRGQGQEGANRQWGSRGSTVRNKVGPGHSCWGLTYGFISRLWGWENRRWSSAGNKQVHRDLGTDRSSVTALSTFSDIGLQPEVSRFGQLWLLHVGIKICVLEVHASFKMSCWQTLWQAWALPQICVLPYFYPQLPPAAFPPHSSFPRGLPSCKIEKAHIQKLQEYRTKRLYEKETWSHRRGVFIYPAQEKFTLRAQF